MKLTALALSSLPLFCFAQQSAPSATQMVIKGSAIADRIAKFAGPDPSGASRKIQTLLQQGLYKLNLEYHERPSGVGLNEDGAELMVVLEGTGTILLGGTPIDPVRSGAHLQAKSAQGGTPYAVEKGDAILIPRAVAHAIEEVKSRLVLMSIHLPTALEPSPSTPSALSPAAVADLSALVGRWQLDPARTHMERYGPDGKNMVRDPTFTFIFSPEPQGLNIAVYARYPQSAPDRTMLLIADGKAHACLDKAACLTVGGDPTEQTYVYHQVDAHLVVRSFFIKGKVAEYSTYGVSADGNTFTMMAWSPETPFWQNIQVFTKQP